MMPRLPDPVLERLLAEDVPYGDLTTLTLGIGARPGRLWLAARAPMVLCGIEEAARLFELAGAGVSARPATTGQSVAAGERLLTAEGSAEALHRAWKVAQTLVEYASGIASAARRLVEAARRADPAAVVACTRKTFPGTRALAVRAIVAGGATPHRLGLSESVLVFAEHRCFLPAGLPLAEAVQAWQAACPEKKLAAEVTGIDEALAFAAAGIDILQLERFSPEATAELAAALQRTGHPARLAAAGGVNEANAEAYVRAGAKLLVSSAPYHAKPADVKVVFEAL